MNGKVSLFPACFAQRKSRSLVYDKKSRPSFCFSGSIPARPGLDWAGSIYGQGLSLHFWFMRAMFCGGRILRAPFMRDFPVAATVGRYVFHEAGLATTSTSGSNFKRLHRVGAWHGGLPDGVWIHCGPVPEMERDGRHGEHRALVCRRDPAHRCSNIQLHGVAGPGRWCSTMEIRQHIVAQRT